MYHDKPSLLFACLQVIVPNLGTRDEDEEVFEMNPVEYIRRDAEGSDSDTRRRAAADLVKSLTERFPAEVTQLFTGYVKVGVCENVACVRVCVCNATGCLHPLGVLRARME